MGSKDTEDSKLAMVAYCPPAKQGTLTADVWMKDILSELGGGDYLFGDATTAKAVLNNDPDKNFFVLKLKDSAISLSINYLKKKGLFPDGNDDDDDDYVFGDDDFPSADVAEAPAEEEEAAGDMDDPMALLGGMGAEDSSAPVKVTAIPDAEGEAPDAAANEDGEPYPDIKYGCETPDRLKGEKMEKKMKKIFKEGGKRGVEIEGAADMGGLQFFCTTMDEPNGDVDMLYESMRAMNEKSDPGEEERKGGSGRIGKMIISKDQADSKLAMVAYCPPSKQDTLTADVWMKDILSELGGGEFLFGDETTAKALLKNDPDKGLFVLKLKDSAITYSINYLKKKGLFPNGNDDDDDDYVFGDDDFPSAEVAEVVAEEPEEEAAGDVDDPFAMMGGMGAEELYKVTAMPEEGDDAVAEQADAVEEGEPYPDIKYGCATP